MTDPLIKLAARCEAATGGDRELDAEIMFDLYAQPVGCREDGGPTGYLWPEDNASWNFGLRFPGKDRAWFNECRKRIDGETLVIERDGALVLMNSLRIPKLTASIDAAMTLMPEGKYWSGGYGRLTDVEPLGAARIFEPHTIEMLAESEAETVALALCAASLRARAHLQRHRE